MAYPLACGVVDPKKFVCKSIPHSWLVDARGVVIWAGHPSGLDESTIEANLKELAIPPVPELPASMSKIAALLKAGSAAKAITELAAHVKKPKTEADGTAAQAAIDATEAFGTAQLAKVDAAITAGKYHIALEILDTLGVQFKGHDIGKKADDKKKELLAGADTKLEMSAAKIVLAAIASAQAGKFDEAQQILAQVALAKKYEATKMVLVAKPMMDAVKAQAAEGAGGGRK